MGLFSAIGSALGLSGGSVFSGAMGLLGGALGYKGQQSANRANVNLANTAYQRAMADMRKAGLNPILAGKLGGAQSPTMLSELGAGVQGFTSAAQTSSNVGLQSSQIGLNESQVEKIGYEVNKVLADTGLSFAQTAQVRQQALKIAAEVSKISAQTSSIEMKNILDKMFTDVMAGHEYIWTAHKMNMGPDKLVDLLSNVVMKFISSKSQTTIMKGK
jgi:hypothetical protein